MDTVDLQLARARQDLASEVRLGELQPSSISAMRCERLYRTISALERRKQDLLTSVATFQPPTHPPQIYRNDLPSFESRTLPHHVYRNDIPSFESRTGPPHVYRNHVPPAETISDIKQPYVHRKVERWLHSDSSTGSQWEWKGRAIRVVKQALYADSDLLQHLIAKATELELKLDNLKNEENKNEYETKVQKGEDIGTDRIRAREAAKSELSKRAAILKRELLENSAVNVQSVFRGHLGRRKMRRAHEEYDLIIRHQGAELIQSRFRGHLARKKVHGLKQEYDQQLTNLAATTLQSQFRGTLARKDFRQAKTSKQREAAGSQMIQAWWRGTISRLKLSSLRANYLASIEEDAAVMLQCAWRCMLARREKDRMSGLRAQALEESAAIMVQAAYRGMQASKRSKKLRKELVDINDQQASMAYADRIKTTFYAKRFLNAKQRAAVLIQSYARNFLKRRRQPLTHQVFATDIQIPIERLNGRKAQASVRMTITESAAPYQLKVVAICTGKEKLPQFYRKIDIAALEQLLSPLFEDPEFDQANDKPSKAVLRWVRTGKPPKRNQLIQWVVERMWIEEMPDGEFELCLGTMSTSAGVHQLDRSLNSALPIGSPPRRQAKPAGGTRESFNIQYAYY